MYYDFIAKLNELDEDLLFEMANATKDDTNLRYNIWLDSMGSRRNNKHNLPRIKVEVKNNMIPVLISDNPDIPDSVKEKGTTTFAHIDEVKKFIIENKDVLLDHWYGRINDRVALNSLKPYER